MFDLHASHTGSTRRKKLWGTANRLDEQAMQRMVAVHGLGQEMEEFLREFGEPIRRIPILEAEIRGQGLDRINRFVDAEVEAFLARRDQQEEPSEDSVVCVE